MAKYHSALAPAISAPRRDRYDSDECTAIVHDVMSERLPEEFAQCDVLYAEPAWRDGFEKFNRRAQVKDQRTYGDYLRAISKVVTDSRKPCVVISGAHARNHLPNANQWIKIVLNGREAIAYVYGMTLDVHDGVTNIELIESLAQRFDCVGDFCCGYGVTGHVFLRHGKRAVLSDVNPMCIGYITLHAQDWYPAGDQA